MRETVGYYVINNKMGGDFYTFSISDYSSKKECKNVALKKLREKQEGVISLLGEKYWEKANDWEMLPIIKEGNGHFNWCKK